MDPKKAATSAEMKMIGRSMIQPIYLIPPFLILSILLLLFAHVDAADLSGGIKNKEATEGLKSVFELGYMASSLINCSFPYFSLPYGCWCGINAVSIHRIPAPIDDFDSACRLHDICYDTVKGDCDWYLSAYSWQLIDDKIVCLDGWMESSCERSICECDKQVVTSIAALSQDQGCQYQNPGCTHPQTALRNQIIQTLSNGGY